LGLGPAAFCRVRHSLSIGVGKSGRTLRTLRETISFDRVRSPCPRAWMDDVHRKTGVFLRERRLPDIGTRETVDLVGPRERGERLARVHLARRGDWLDARRTAHVRAASIRRRASSTSTARKIATSAAWSASSTRKRSRRGARCWSIARRSLPNHDSGDTAGPLRSSTSARPSEKKELI
jgi:hypothetical protein